MDRYVEHAPWDRHVPLGMRHDSGVCTDRAPRESLIKSRHAWTRRRESRTRQQRGSGSWMRAEELTAWRERERVARGGRGASHLIGRGGQRTELLLRARLFRARRSYELRAVSCWLSSPVSGENRLPLVKIHYHAGCRDARFCSFAQ